MRTASLGHTQFRLDGQASLVVAVIPKHDEFLFVWDFWNLLCWFMWFFFIYQLNHWANRYWSFQRSSEQVGASFVPQLNLVPFLIATEKDLMFLKKKLCLCFLLNIFCGGDQLLPLFCYMYTCTHAVGRGVNQCKQKPCSTIDEILGNRAQSVWCGLSKS